MSERTTRTADESVRTVCLCVFILYLISICVHSLWSFNPRTRLGCQTGVETAIAAERPFLGLFPPEFLWLKALEALSNFPAACQVVGGKPGSRRRDEVGLLD